MRAPRALAVLLLILLSGCAGSPLMSGPVPTTETPPTSPSAAPALASNPSSAPSAPADPVSGELRITFLDVGQGQATLLQAPDATMLIDAGRHDRDDVVADLKRHGVEQLDVIAISHPHADHVGQLADVLAAFPVGEVWMSGAVTTTETFGHALDALTASNAGYEEPRAGNHAAIGSMNVEVLGPVEPLAGDLHVDSLILRVTYGAVSVLLTGDAGADVEAQLLARNAESVAATVYQVAHHGSSTSSSAAFLEAVAPQIAVYSAGAGNGYGHPTPEVLRRLGEVSAAIYGTDVHGDVTVITDGTDVAVSTARAGSVPALPPARPPAIPLPVPGPLPAPAAAVEPPTSADPPASCDPNYVGACVPVYPPDVNCGSVDATRFAVVGKDVHNLDGDADGVGCES